MTDRRSRRPLALAGVLVTAAAAALPAFALPSESALIEAWREEGARFELGKGVAQDMRRAVAAYCAAARLGDADSQFRLGWMHANGSGVERSDSIAAFFFEVAAEQGVEQARYMLKVVGGPTTEIPPCMREPEPAAPSAATIVPEEPVLPERPAPPDILALVRRIAPEFKVEPRLVLAIIEVESRFDSVALSNRNAKGLMQLLPETAARFAVRNPYDSAQNIRGGTAYLRWLLAYFQGDVRLVAAAYNAGERAVERYRGVPPYRETRSYVQQIVQRVGATPQPYDPRVTPPSAVLPDLARRSTGLGR